MHATLPTNESEPSAGARTAILGAAQDIFARVGLAGARTDAIAAKAAVNKALLYYYFQSKDELYRAVLEEQMKEFHKRAMEVLAEKGPASRTLVRYVSLYFDFLSGRRYFPALYQRLIMTGDKCVADLVRKYAVPRNRRLLALIRRGIREGEFRRVDPHHTAISLVALSVFYFAAAPMIRTVVHADPFAQANVARRKQEVLEFIRYGLLRKPGVICL